MPEALAAALPAGYFHTRGAQILDAGNNPVCLAGVNWYGFECNTMVPGGLSYQTLDYICRKVVNLGFNLIRLPYSVQAVQSNPRIDNYLDANDHLQGRTVLQIMDALIATAAGHGLKVVADDRRIVLVALDQQPPRAEPDRLGIRLGVPQAIALPAPACLGAVIVEAHKLLQVSYSRDGRTWVAVFEVESEAEATSY